MEYEFDRLLAVIGAAFDLAYRDAHSGHEDAVDFLDDLVPEWRRTGRARQGENKVVGQIGQQTNESCNGDIPVGLPLEKEEIFMARNVVAEAMQIVKQFGETDNADLQNARALDRWLDLGGSEATFARINGRHFAGMTEAAQTLLVKEMEGSNNV